VFGPAARFAYECLARYAAVPGDDVMAVAMAHVCDGPQALPAHVPRAAPNLVMMAMAARDPANRLPTAASMAMAARRAADPGRRFFRPPRHTVHRERRFCADRADARRQDHPTGRPCRTPGTVPEVRRHHCCGDTSGGDTPGGGGPSTTG
jgi:hypothetical protein